VPEDEPEPGPEEETKEEKVPEEVEQQVPVPVVAEDEGDPVEVQVNLLKKQLLLAQQACFLSLIQLDKDRNPNGGNQNHRYEDLRKEIAKCAEH